MMTPAAPAVASRLRVKRCHTMERLGSAKAYPRIGDRVEDIREQASRDDHHGGHEEETEDHRVILVVERVEVESADAGPREHRLRDEGAAEEVAELETAQRDERDERVAQRVTQEDRALAQALGARGADVVLADDLENARARVATPGRRHPEPEDQRGTDEVNEAIPQRERQAERRQPPRGNPA